MPAVLDSIFVEVYIQTAMRAIALILFLFPVVFAGQISFKLDDYGLSQLYYNGQPILNASRSFFCFGYTLTHPNATKQNIYQDQNTLNGQNKSVDADGNGFTLLRNDYKYYCRYSVPVENEFMISCVVSNLHPSAAMSGWAFALMRKMKPPAEVTIYNRGETGYDEASYSVVTTSGGDFAMAAYPMSYRVPTTIATSPNYDEYSMSSNWRPRKAEDFIPVGGSITLEWKIKFFAFNTTIREMAQEPFDFFTEQYPMTLNWPDRRPILTHFAASGFHASPTNPRGFFNQPEADFVSESGKANFKTTLLASAREMVKNMQAVNAQGMILWDMEGSELPHAITYIGDPIHAELMAPEMVGAIDEYFKIITDAGFKCGLTIRPQQMEFGSEVPVGPCVNNSVYIHYNGDFRKKGYTCINDVYYISLPYFQPPGGEPTEIMINKMKYAKERWGCTIFYVDSNAHPGAFAYPSDIHEAVLDAVPGILVLPENDYPRYFRSMAPYGEIDMNVWFQNSMYPESFAAINVQDGALNIELLTESTLRGNVFLARGWFSDTRTTDLYSILQSVEKNYTYSIDGATEVQGYVGQKISIGVTLTADRKSGITFDWQATKATIIPDYNQFLSTVEVVYNEPGTYTVDLIVRRGITAKNHTVTVNVTVDPSKISGSSVLEASMLFLVAILFLKLVY